MALLGLVSIIGWVAFLTFLFKKYAAIFPFVVTSAIIGLLYISAYILLLYPVGILLLFSGIILPIIYLSIKLKSGPSFFWEEIKSLPPGFYFLLIFGLCWFFWTKTATIFGWDEFFWGQFAKVLHADHRLYTITSSILDEKASYPPAVPLFQYFFVQLGEFKESALYFAQGIFVLSTFAFFINFVGRSLWRISSMIIIVFLVLVLFGPGLLSLTNDHILGLPFACAFIAIFYLLPTPKEKLWILPTIFILPLIKVTGIVLAGTLLLAVLFDLIMNRKVIGNRVSKLYSSIMIAIIFLTPLISMKSWDFYLQMQHLPANSSLVDYPKIRSAFSKNASPRYQQTIENFKDAFYKTRINNITAVKVEFQRPVLKLIYDIQQKIQFSGLSLLYWLLIGLAIIFSTLMVKGKEKLRVTIISAILIIGCGIYLLTHLLVYLFSFSELEGIGLSSYSRYINSFIIAFIMICISIFIYNISGQNHRRTKILLSSTMIITSISIIFFMTPPFIENYLLSPNSRATTTSMVREKINPGVIEIINKTPKTSKIWYIYQGSNGWEAMIARYEIFPRRMNGWNWSLGPVSDSKDFWTNNYTPNEWIGSLASGDYTHVYLGNTNNSFWSRYNSVFENPATAQKSNLFLVVKDDGKIFLRSL